MKPGKSRSGFTLLEMLVVLGILGIVMAAAIPAFIGMNEGAAMRASVSDLKATLSAARQWAITHFTDVYVVFPDSLASSDPDADKAYHAYNVFSVKEGEYIGEWRYLKSGVYFIPSQADEPPNLATSTLDTKNVFQLTTASVPFPSSTSSPKTMPAIRIKKNGQLAISGGFFIEAYLAEGVAPTVGDRAKFFDASPVFGVEMARLTGGLSVTDYKIP